MTIDFQSFEILLEKNLEVKIRQLEQDKTSTGATLGRYFIPKLYFFSGIENEKDRSSSESLTGSGLGFNLNLFSGGLDRNTFENDQISIKQSANQKELTKRLLVKKTRGLYYQLLEVIESQKILSEYKKLNLENLSLLKRKVGSGLMLSSDLLENSLDEVDINEKMAHLSEKEKMLREDLAFIMNDRDTVIYPNPKVLDSGLGALTSKKLSELFLEQDRLELEKQYNQVSFSNYKTQFKIDLYGEYSFTTKHLGEIVDESTQAQRVIGLKLTWDLWDHGGQRSIKRQQESLEAEKIAMLKMHDSQKRESDLNKLKYELNSTLDLIKIAENKNALLSQILSKNIYGFKNGVKDSGDLRESTRQLVENKLRVLTLKIKKLSLEDEIHL